MSFPNPRRAGDHFMFLCLSIGLETGVINRRSVTALGKFDLNALEVGASWHKRRGHLYRNKE